MACPDNSVAAYSYKFPWNLNRPKCPNSVLSREFLQVDVFKLTLKFPQVNQEGLAVSMSWSKGLTKHCGAHGISISKFYYVYVALCILRQSLWLACREGKKSRVSLVLHAIKTYNKIALIAKIKMCFFG